MTRCLLLDSTSIDFHAILSSQRHRGRVSIYLRILFVARTLVLRRILPIVTRLVSPFRSSTVEQPSYLFRGRIFSLGNSIDSRFFHGRFGNDDDDDDKIEREKTVTERRKKRRSSSPGACSVFKIFYFQRDVRG